MGRGTEALDYYNQALPLWREAGERGGEALTLGNIAIVYDNLGEKQKSLEFYESGIGRVARNRQPSRAKPEP